jgi:hypothetical protein
MRKLSVVVVAVLAVVVGTVLPAGAVTGNYQRDFTNTGVGLLVTYDADGEFDGRCSGTLLTPTVFLTAGHCTSGSASGRVYFEQDAGANFDPSTGVDPVSGYPETGGVTGSIHTMPGYDDYATFPNTRDLGIVVLDEPVTDVAYASLPTVGSLDVLASRVAKRSISFTVSGYGVNYINPAKLVSLRERMSATASLVNLRSNLADGYNLAHSGNPGQGKGGTCFGDSGGPVFLAGTDTIVGVTSFGLSSQTCSGPGFAYRTDQQEALDWIASFVADGETLRIVPLA